jgi:hypothetical protein
LLEFADIWDRLIAAGEVRPSAAPADSLELRILNPPDTND